MPQIIPIRDLKKTNEVAERCRQAKEPVNDVYKKLEEGEASIETGNVKDGFESLRLLNEIREKLEESDIAAADPTARRYTHEEIFGPLRERFGYEV